MKIIENGFSVEEEFDTVDARIEHFNSWKDHLPHFIKRNMRANPKNNVCIVKSSLNFDKKTLFKKWYYAENKVGTAGDTFYAEAGPVKAGNESYTIDFTNASGRQELGNGSQGTPGAGSTYSALIGPITASRKIINATYPKTADPDADNTGGGATVATWLTSWTTSDFNDGGITGGVIHDAAGSPVAGSNLLTYWTITSFAKTSTDTLKIFINHTMSGQ